jgi:hypothetical protein
MNGYTITAAKLGSWGLRLLVVVVCLFSTVGCAGDLWMYAYRVKGGYYKRDAEIRRMGDGEVKQRPEARKGH